MWPITGAGISSAKGLEDQPKKRTKINSKTPDRPTKATAVIAIIHTAKEARSDVTGDWAGMVSDSGSIPLTVEGTCYKKRITRSN